MSAQVSEKSGFWKKLWRALVGSAPASVDETPVPEPIVPAPFVLDRDVGAPSRIGASENFMLAARLASAHSLNAPVQRRDGKPPVTPRAGKPLQAQKAKPRAAATVVKKTQPARHVCLSSRPEPKSADIIRFVPRSQRQGLVRAA